MNLIDHYSSKFNNTKSYSILNTLLQIIKQPSYITQISSTSLLILTQTPVTIPFFKSFIKIILDIPTSLLLIRTIIIGQDLIKIRNLFQITFLIRKFFKLQPLYGNYIFFIHPFTGQLCFQLNYFLNTTNLSLNIEYLAQTINSIIFQFMQTFIYLYQYIVLLFPNLLKHLRPSYRQQTQINSDKLQTFRNYIVHSCEYTWQLLTGSTSRNSKFYFYDDLKPKYKNMPKILKRTQIQYKLQTVSNHSITQFQMKQLLQTDDNQIRKNYYVKQIFINHDKQILVSLTPPPNFIKNLQNIRQFKVISSEGKYIAVIHRFLPSEKSRLLHYKQIISKLPNLEFPYLPKYFNPKYIEKQTQLILITNLYKCKKFFNYMENNSTTISIFTKFHIFYQIIITLQYLRDNKIVYHGLCPDNIYIKKGLDIQLFDFSNSHHQNQMNSIEFKNNFPYYCKKSDPMAMSAYQEQRSDVRSFCYLLYENLFKKQMINMKDSTKKYINKNFRLHSSQILNLKKISLQKSYQYGDIMIQLLHYLCLAGYYFPNQKHKLEQVPYMDWMVILMKYSQNYYFKLL